MTTFKPGDVVLHRSTGIVATIESITDDRVTGIWFDTEQRLYRKTWLATEVELYDPNKAIQSNFSTYR